MNNILVTGGLGFIGSHFVRLLVENDYNVIVLDKMTYAADIRRIKDISDSVKLYIGDIWQLGTGLNPLDEKIIEYYDIDCIVNFAAETHVDNSIKNSREFVYSNFIGVHSLLEICRKSKEKGKNIRFIQIGTDEVYGSTQEGSFKETSRLNAGNPYSATKAAADLLCLSYFNTYGLDLCITRSSNNYGPWQHTEKFIPRMVSLGIAGKDLEVYGNGDNVRDWLWVEDNCNGILAVMKNGISGEIYNIGAGNEMGNNQVAEYIARRFGVGIKYIKDRAGHDYRYSISFNKIWKDLGWKPHMGFYDCGLRKTIEFYEGLCGDNSGGKL